MTIPRSLYTCVYFCLNAYPDTQPVERQSVALHRTLVGCINPTPHSTQGVLLCHVLWALIADGFSLGTGHEDSMNSLITVTFSVYARYSTLRETLKYHKPLTPVTECITKAEA